MSHQALAIEYRPQRFDDLIGQTDTVTALRNTLDQQQLHHAYLFSGTRGVGKTTLARLLAKCFNCETGITATPCEVCPTCVDITQGRHVDLIEIDAASRTKVEDTRDLLDNVPYAPTSGRFKIYLIDEVHMLSKHSFNALLKTLEEPPAHVKFILATTEPEKIPVTVRSRCLHFALQALSEVEIVSRLTHILDQKQMGYDDEALTAIAQAAKGSMRDALSLLDKIIAYCDTHIATSQVHALLGVDQDQLAYTLAAQLAEADYPALLESTAAMAKQHHDFVAQCRSLCTLWYQLATRHLLQQHGITTLEANEAQDALLAQLDPAQIQVYYQICLAAQKDLPSAPTPQIGFEMTLMRMLAFAPSDQPQPTPKAQTTKTNTQRSKQPTPQRRPTTARPTSHHATAESPADQRWHDTIDHLALTGFAKQLAEHCACTDWDTETITLQLAPKHQPLLSDTQKSKIEQALQAHLGNKVQLHINLLNASQKTSEGTAAKTPAAQKEAMHQAKMAKTLDSLHADPHVQAVQRTFNATLMEDSVTLKESADH